MLSDQSRHAFNLLVEEKEHSASEESGQWSRCWQWRQSASLENNKSARQLGMLDETLNITQRLSHINNVIMEMSGECQEEKDTTYGEARVTFSGSWANDKAVDLQWASSMENKRYPIVVFNCEILREPRPNPAGARHHLAYRLVNGEARIITQILSANGFTELGSSNQDFNLMWTSSNPNPNIFKSLLPHQRVNHFPRSYELTRKDRMYKNIERLQQAKGFKHFNFLPKTFILPTEFTEFSATFNKIRGIIFMTFGPRGISNMVNSQRQHSLDKTALIVIKLRRMTFGI